MANYCSNSVLFLGDAATVKAIHELFVHIESEQQRTRQYYLPEFVTADRGHMIDISLYQDKLSYETRWSPNLDLLVQIADHYGVDFIASFHEMVNGLYGEALYQGRELKSLYRLAWAEEDLSDDAELSAMRDEQRLLIEKHAGPGYQR